jgi:hypothetical protein
LAHLESQREVFDLALALREPYRTAIYLRYYEDLTPTQIAERLDVPVKTVKTRLSRALTELRSQMDERFEGGRGAWINALLPVTIPRGTLGAVTTAASILGGGLVLKKIVAGTVAVFVVLGLWKHVGGLGAELAATTKAPAELGSEPARPADDSEPFETAPAALAAETQARNVVAIPLEGLPTGALLVHVSWSDGSPAADVGLEAICDSDSAPREESLWGRTDPNGALCFEGLSPGNVRIYVDRGLSLEAHVAASETTEQTIVLPPGSDVVGTVVGPDGEPVPGAEIYANRLHRWPTGRRIGAADARGAFRLRSIAIEVVPTNGSRSIGARADGFLPSVQVTPWSLPVNARGERTVRLELGPSGGRISGRVLNPDGTPFEGAWVQAGPHGGNNVDGGAEATPVLERTDAGGRFDYPGDLEPGSQPIHVIARGFPVWSARADVRPGEQTFVEVQLELPARIEGTVTTPAGEAVEGVRVVAAERVGDRWLHYDFPPPQATTDARGRFVLDWVSSGAQELNAYSPYGSRLGTSHKTLTCSAGETTHCELVLDLGRTISGRLVDSEGAPLEGWRVHGEPFNGRLFSRQDDTDSQGSFLLANLGDCAFNLMVSAPGENPTPARAQLVDVQPAAEGLEIVVEDCEARSAWVDGVLLGKDDRVPRDVAMVIQKGDTQECLFVEFDVETGAFHRGPLPSGSYRLGVCRDDRVLLWTDPFEVFESETHHFGVLRIASPGSVEILIRGVPEESLASLKLKADRFGHNTRDLTLENGRFRVDDLAPGEWLVRLRNDPACMRDVLVEIVSGEVVTVERTLEPGLPIRVTCEVADRDDPWHFMTLEITDTVGDVFLHESHLPRQFLRDGVMRSPSLSLPPGSYFVEAWTDTGRRARGPFSVENAMMNEPPALLLR